ncbi:UDP-glucuronosyl/UDP-glucosyltransferase [Trema orientale]|uniref:UDP-glucuronosyl/UDP-glucosyltransferase n=1 Tax=Trema orientale TaxID=63057 RepID=A0A2P5EXT0_TREOI|nr:UDP-glucuronosyl/UDP-glucosyltransferase [Trema orientale]
MATPHHQQRLRQKIVVVVVPFPAQSYPNQLLRFSHVLTSYNIPVHYVSSTLHISQVKSRGSIPLQHLTKIQFHHFATPPFPCSPLNLVVRNKFPKHGFSFMKAITRLRQPIVVLLRSLSLTARRLVVVYDTLMVSVVKDVFSLANVESYSFDSASALSCFAFTCELFRNKEKWPLKDIPSGVSCFPYLFQKFLADQMVLSKISKAGSLYNSCRAIEGSFLREIFAMDKFFGRKKIWQSGPYSKQRP